jgi:hypothetical protein
VLWRKTAPAAPNRRVRGVCGRKGEWEGRRRERRGGRKEKEKGEEERDDVVYWYLIR